MALRLTLRDAGVPEDSITVTAETEDANSLIVCDHYPDGAAPTEPLTLEVAQNCSQEDDSDKKRRKRPMSSRRR